jgi:hypothetical protein
VADYRGSCTALLVLACITMIGCGSGERSGGAVTAAALTAADRTRVARAAAYTAEIARYRGIASEERRLAAAYARWTAPARATKDWNATLKARVEARAAAVDQIAAKLQTLADFQTAEAGKEIAR